MNTQHFHHDPDLTAAEQAAIDEGAADDAARAAAAAPPADAAPAAPAAPAPSAADEAATRLAAAADRLAAAADQQAALAAAAAAPATPAAPADPAPTPRDFKAELDALDQQFDDGEMDQAEHRRREREILSEQAEARALAAVREENERAAARARETQEANAEQAWKAANDAFFADPGNAKLIGDPIQRAAFEAAVGVVFKEEGGNIAYDALLVKARERITGVASVDPGKATREAQFERQQQLDRAPQTLRDVPSSADADTSPGASLDNLPIDQLEAALARMSQADRDKYLASAPGGLHDNPRAVA